MIAAAAYIIGVTTTEFSTRSYPIMRWFRVVSKCVSKRCSPSCLFSSSESADASES